MNSITRTSISLILLILVLFSCKKDTLPTSPKEKQYYITGKINFTDIQSLPTAHQVSLQLFVNEDDKFPALEFELDKTNDGNAIHINQEIKKEQFGTYFAKVSIIETPVRTIELVNYGSIEVNKKTILPEQSTTIATFEKLSNILFNNCILCHGQNPNHIAANLNLMPGHVYNSLVNKPATHSNLMLIKPFEPENSFIMNVLRQKDIDFTHEASTPIWQIKKELLENWILHGAER